MLKKPIGFFNIFGYVVESAVMVFIKKTSILKMYEIPDLPPLPPLWNHQKPLGF